VDFKSRNKIIYILLVLFRVLSFLIFPKFPLATWILVFIADIRDYRYAIRAGLTFKQYQYTDKTVDFLTRIYFVHAAYALNWGHASLFLVLLIFRGVGDLLYLLTKSEKHMFYFPNIIEFFFLGYIFYLKHLPQTTETIVWLLVISTVLKILHEWWLHVYEWIDKDSLAFLKKHPGHKRQIPKRYLKK
jgi:hypothetical protein